MRQCATTVSGDLNFSFVPSGVFNPAPTDPNGQYTIRVVNSATNPPPNGSETVNSPVNGKNAIGTFMLT